MGYLHINNLYKNQTILMFKECYALEKIHGTSAHISWNADEKNITFFSGGEKYDRFIRLFDAEFLKLKFIEIFPQHNVTIFGEAYGGKQQGMSDTYGMNLKFIAFDVLINNNWSNVLNCEDICKKFNIEFVSYVKISTDLESLNNERDLPSVQAIRNGCGDNKMKEGIVLRPLSEFLDSNGNRVIAKHKRDEFKETKNPRNVTAEELKILSDAKLIAEEWVTQMRLIHVLDKLKSNIDIKDMELVINAMRDDIIRESAGEIILSKNVLKFIGNRTAYIFKEFLKTKQN